MTSANKDADLHADFAKKAAEKLIDDYCECNYRLDFKSDDGGKVLQVMVETPSPSQPLLEHHPEFPIEQLVPRFCDWGTIILKVPVGYLSSL